MMASASTSNSYCMWCWYQLSDVDKYAYQRMRATISSRRARAHRNKRVELFVETVAAIRAFAIRQDADDILRSMACGILWVAEGLAINTHQLNHTLGKCKSSINGSLLKMGYTITLGRNEAAAAIVDQASCLRNNAQELRHWTVRSMPCHIMSDTVCRELEAADFQISLSGITKKWRRWTPPRVFTKTCFQCANPYYRHTLINGRPINGYIWIRSQ